MNTLPQQIDMLITGSSRPDLLEKTVNSFIKNLKYSGTLRILFHEDYVFKAESDESVAYAQRSELFDVVEWHDPHVGLGEAINCMLPKIGTKYIFYLQDDWELEREVDLDGLVRAFDEHEELRHVHFNKYRTTGSMSGFQQLPHNFSGIDMCLYNAWSLLPSLWRASFIKPRWIVRYERPEGYFTNSLGNHQQRLDTVYCKRFIGAYIYGAKEEYRYLRHLGNKRRMASWRLVDGRPGGREMPEEFDRKHACDAAYERIWRRKKPK